MLRRNPNPAPECLAMTVADQHWHVANRRYQRDLAEALVAGLGFDAALETCRQNAWEGALGVLLARKMPPYLPRVGSQGGRHEYRDE